MIWSVLPILEFMNIRFGIYEERKKKKNNSKKKHSIHDTNPICCASFIARKKGLVWCFVQAPGIVATLCHTIVMYFGMLSLGSTETNTRIIVFLLQQKSRNTNSIERHSNIKSKNKTNPSQVQAVHLDNLQIITWKI